MANEHGCTDDYSLPRPHDFYAFDSQLLFDLRRSDFRLKCRVGAGMRQHRVCPSDATGLRTPD